MVYTARMVPWEHGWELHVDGIGVTQVSSLEDDAEQQVRNLVETTIGRDASDATVRITVSYDKLRHELGLDTDD